jgi:superfamily II DNA or RNA helicase
MGLRDIQLKPAYDSDEDDILNDFYIPALSNSISYRRLAGFFSSSALAVAARGIAGLIKNGGTMKLVVGAKLRKQDVDAITKGLKTREEAFSGQMIQDLDSIESEFVKDHVKALAFMVATGKLEIKVAVPLAQNPEESDEFEGLYHMKVGILSDDAHSISFSGSINESRTGWIKSIEEFKVFCSWNTDQGKYLKMDVEKFEKYWSGSAKRALVIDIPTAVRNKLIDMAPESVDQLHLERYSRPARVALWKNQTEAIEAWVKNGYKGIFAMATGSGKTLAALVASSLAERSVITVVLVPTEPILQQWTTFEIPQFDQSARIITCSGRTPEWKTILPIQLGDIRRLGQRFSPQNRVYAVAILNTASRMAFLKAWEGIPPANVQIICDEVHHVGAASFQRCMEIQTCRQLGLSATPERDWDPIGTMEITEYFGPTVYEYGIRRAIEEGHLCHYLYYPFFAFLDSQEFEEFRKLSEQIDKELAKIKSRDKAQGQRQNSLSATRKLERLLEERAKIKKKAKDKVRAFRGALSATTKRPLIIFCEDEEQLSEVESVLKENGFSYLVYTSRMSDWQRQKALEVFRNGGTQIILAIRCLDEGLNVPECEGCIIVASSSSDREFIQRRGRILRGIKGKRAVLNDIVVLPAETVEHEDMKVAETLVRQELSRVKKLVEASDNEWECRNAIRRELTRYGLESLADI